VRIDDLETALQTGTFEPTHVEYKDGWELLLRHCSAHEQRRELAGREVTDAKSTAFWLGHVLGWRGLTRNGQEQPFDAKLLRQLWDLDAEFSGWLVRTCQAVDTFRRRPGAAAAPGVGADQS
jgi:hypothetical protein